MPKVSIIILNYNTFELTCQCIQSVITHTQQATYEIIVVDNNSTECSAKKFKEKFSQIILVESKENGGFAKGNNLGIAAAEGEFILLLNSDAYLTEDAISQTLQHYQQQGLQAVIGCRMIYPNGGIQHTARKFRSISWELLDVARFLLYILPYKQRASLMLGKYFKANFNTYCDWLNGAFYLFPSKALQQMKNGKLDERFFMYGEDHLWSWQFKQLGYPSYFYSQATIVHINNGSTAKEKRLKLLNTMLANEIEIMKAMHGNGFYYKALSFIYTCKEKTRIAVKQFLAK